MAYAPVPVSNTSGSNFLGQLQAYSLQRKALDALRPMWRFYQVCMHDDLGLREGKTRRWFRYTNLGANTNPVAEGQVGTSIGMSPSKPIDATISQYADFMTISDILQASAPDAIMESYADQLGFRAGFTVDNVTRSVIDAETGAAQAKLGAYLTIRDFHAATSILQGANVMPMDGGWFKCLTHAYTAFDIMNDPSSGGIVDLHKYTDPDLVTGKGTDRGFLLRQYMADVTISNNVKMTSGSPNQWRTYVFGAGAVGTVSLSGYKPNQVVDPNKETFKVFSKVENTPSLYNPTGQIGGFVSYNFTHVTKVLEGPSTIGGSFRYAYIDTPSSIVA